LYKLDDITDFDRVLLEETILNKSVITSQLLLDLLSHVINCMSSLIPFVFVLMSVK
jgi:hypothetical protein